MEYKRKIWTVALISVLFIIGALLADVNSFKEKQAPKQENAQNTDYTNYETPNNDYTNEQNENSQDVKVTEEANPQADWFQEYDKTSQDIIEKYTTEENYLTNAVNTQGQIVKWDKRNLKIYIEEGRHKNAVIRGVAEFKNTFSDILTLTETHDKHLSDIEVTFESRPTAKPNSLELGQTMPQYNNEGIIQKSYMQLFTIHPITKKEITEDEIYATFLHEMGHAIGIVGHSQNPNDLMYASATRSSYSGQDVSTVRAIYSKKGMSAEAKSQAAQNKLEEAENYAKKYSKESIAWINLAQTYYAQNNYAKAAEAYKEAIKISPNDASIYIGLASCYYASKKYDEAIECLKWAQSLNLDDYQRNRIIELLSYNYNAKGDLDNGYFYTKEALDANPYDKNNLGNFLIVCAKTKRKDEAKTYLRNYLEAKPEDRDDPALKDFADVFGL